MHATPRPWKVILASQNYNEAPNAYTIEVSQGGLRSIIARGYDGELCPEHGGTFQANAALIVKAVNTHERAKALLQDIDTWFRYDCPPEIARKSTAIQAEVLRLLTDTEG